MYKASSGAIEHINIFKVSNINTTLKFLEKKIFGFMVLITNIKKFLEVEWKGDNIFYLVQKDLY